MKNSNTLHDLPAEERPRERLREVGVDNLSLQELLALVIERGKADKNVLTLAQDLLSHFGSLAKIKEATITELQEIKGIGEATACKLKAAFKLGEKSEVENNRYGQEINDAEDIFNLLKNDLKDKKKEHMKLISLDSRDKVININNISIGTLNSNLAHPREVFEKAIRDSAAKIILAHNHPSGDPEPSYSDVEMTKKIKQSGNILNISVNDHIIVTSNNYFSFEENNLLN